MNSIFLILSERISRAIAISPNYFNPEKSIITISVYILFTLAVGYQTKFLQWQPHWGRIAINVILTSLIAPAILEELVFRVVLLPSPSSSVSAKSYFFWSILSLFLFVIYHPLNAVTFYPQGKIFFTPVFLILAGALGICCTIVYWQTNSLWLPVTVHWLAVVFWLLCFSGLEKLNYKV